MAKFVSPLLGYNNNVRHKNRVFHIQTEDSGVNHPHIITHLFMDGGRILKSVKKSYAEHVGTEGMTEVVRQMMKEQHKAMFIALRDGQYDHIVDPNAAPPATAAADAAATATGPAAAAETATTTATAAAPATAAATTTAAAAAEAATAPPVAGVTAASLAQDPTRAEPPPPATATAITPAAPPEARVVLAPPDAEDVPATTRQPEPPGAAALTLDLDAVEQSAATDGGFFRANDLPPPPKNLFAKERGTGTYRTVDAEPDDLSRPPPSAKPAAAKSPQPARVASRPPPSTQKGPTEGGRYAPARPAAIFGASSKPQAQPIFSDDLVSDKSLDEVILSYLAEDLEPPRRK